MTAKIPDPSSDDEKTYGKRHRDMLTYLRSLADDVAALKAAQDAVIDADNRAAQNAVAKASISTTKGA